MNLYLPFVVSDRNLNFHARLELGIDPDDLGDPIRAAGSSFVSFAIGAVFPIIPWLFMNDGEWAFYATLSMNEKKVWHIRILPIFSSLLF